MNRRRPAPANHCQQRQTMPQARERLLAARADPGVIRVIDNGAKRAVKVRDDTEPVALDEGGEQGLGGVLPVHSVSLSLG